VLWAGVILTIAVVLFSGLWHFDARVAFDFPPQAFSFSSGFLLGLGSATLVAMYDFLGYYGVCYIGDEVRNPSRTIPRSILISVIVVAIIYLTMNISIIGVVPWREAMQSKFLVSEFMERLYGAAGGVAVTVLICWTALASVFALMLGYSRIPYAAARDGFFFSAFGRLHPRGDFPHVSLLVLGAVSIAAGFFSMETVISGLITTRILVQFIAQIVALMLIRRQPSRQNGFHMPLYPLPSLVALLGWAFIFGTSGLRYIVGGLGTMAAGVVAFFVWTWWQRRWPRTDELV
jgi:amino acid transporter